MSEATSPPAKSVQSAKKRKGSVKWLAMEQIVKTGIEAGQATRFARLADARGIQGQFPDDVYELVGPPGDYTVDYVADTGDGFRATYCVARSLAGFRGTEAQRQTQPAHLLVFGGDEVYPVASVEEYDNRLAYPFELADHTADYARGWVVALPGNHDWYDALAAFRRNFCESWLSDDRTITEDGLVRPSASTSDIVVDRHAFQSRSYFSVKLPHGWWLWGVDIQLDSYIDTIQLEYFLRARDRLQEWERVILCTARPSWLDDPRLDSGHYTSNREMLTWFVNRMFGNDDDRSREDRLDQVMLALAGDKHHYVRYERTKQGADEPTAPMQLVTCGGGGAYLSSTHHEKARLSVPWHLRGGYETEYRRVEEYPGRWMSRLWLSSWFLRIAVVNGPVTPLLVAMAGMVLGVSIANARMTGEASAAGLLMSAVGVLAVVLGLLSWAFRRRWIGAFRGALPGLAHAAAHLCWAWLCVARLPGLLGKPGMFDSGTTWSSTVDNQTGALATVAAVLGAGSLVVFSLYFLLCDLLIHWHENEFFAGMRIQGYKSHLRLTVSPSDQPNTAGKLTVTAHGIRRAPFPKRRGARPANPRVTTIDEFDIDPTMHLDQFRRPPG